MAVVVSIDWAGFTAENYDKGMEIMDLGKNPAKGLLSHVASFDNQGAHITDVWESAEDFQSFVGGRLAPVMQQLGITGEPPTVITDAHNVLIP